MKSIGFRWPFFWVIFSFFLTFIVVLLGAYTRLTDAGLGCPDWPGCYGHFLVTPGVLEPLKAWTEMIHRYMAGSLGLNLWVMGFLFFFLSRQGAIPRRVGFFSLFLPFLVLFQALFGLWTVTLKLLPIVVLIHLLGGMLVLGTLARVLAAFKSGPLWKASSLHPWILGGVILVFAQVVLGGWVSTHYAGLSCIGFPTCNGLWFPPLESFSLLDSILPKGGSYEGGILSAGARWTIQYIHRIGAVISLIYIIFLYFKMRKRPDLRSRASLLLVLVWVQCFLGVVNVTHFLPLWSAVSHSGVGLLLFAYLMAFLEWDGLERLTYAA